MRADEVGMLWADELRRMCVPLEECVSVVPGDVDLKVVAILEDRGFDQAPVYDAAHRVAWGLVETPHLRMLAKRGDPLSADDPIVRDDKVWFRIGAAARIDDLLDTMARRKAVLVVQESDAT